MFVRFIVIGLILIVSPVITWGQQSKTDQRFKQEKHASIVFAEGDDYELKCDIYQPIAQTPRPVMLVIHGGAWTTGTRFSMIRHARILANRGYVAMAFDYRLAPKFKWPAQIHDCKHAVRWIREHADQYNVDPERVYVYGYSAGGHLGSMLATTDKDDGFEGEDVAPYSKHSTRIQGLIAGGSPMDFSWLEPDSRVLKHWIGETRGEDPEKYLAASPVTYVTQDDPAAILYHGSTDLLVPTSSPEEFLTRYQKEGLPAELIRTETGHVSTFTGTTVFLQCLHKLEDQLAKDRTRQKMITILGWAAEFQMPSGSATLDELVEFAVEKKGLTKAQVLSSTTSERDGETFVLGWTADEISVEERNGVDDEKLLEKRSTKP